MSFSGLALTGRSPQDRTPRVPSIRKLRWLWTEVTTNTTYFLAGCVRALVVQRLNIEEGMAGGRGNAGLDGEREKPEGSESRAEAKAAPIHER